MNPRLRRGLILGGVALGASAFTLLAVRARADGIPEADGMTYTGYLEDSAGEPLTGEHSIAVQFWESAEAEDDLCMGKQDSAELQSGRFQVPLPISCSEAIQASPDVWVSVDVDGATLGRTKLGAVPYAIEAGHATTADEAIHAETAETAANAPVVTEWATYPGTVSTGNVPIPGSTVRSVWRRVGDSAEVKIEARFVAATVSGTWRFNLPEGLEIDFTKHTQLVDVVGVGRTNFGGTESMCTVQTQDVSPTSVSVNLLGATALANSPTDGQYATVMLTVPIVGWTATTPAP